mgnify:CR=1 FL=1
MYNFLSKYRNYGYANYQIYNARMTFIFGGEHREGIPSGWPDVIGI